VSLNFISAIYNIVIFLSIRKNNSSGWKIRQSPL
jgi:hypothetical protein